MKKSFLIAGILVQSGIMLAIDPASQNQKIIDGPEFSNHRKITKIQGKPNVLFIYADDLGYGDLSCYGNKVFKTPNIDKLAEEGVKFTRAYCTAATSTPSRYSLLTGQYPWRKKGVAVLPGDAKSLIEPGRETVSNVMKNSGYFTGIIGKWHLGLGIGKDATNWNEQIEFGPTQMGFDYSYIMAATNDRVPTVFLENQRVVNLDLNDPINVSYSKNISPDPTGKKNPELLKIKHSQGHDGTIVNGIGRIGFMSGGKKARWIDEEITNDYLKKAKFFFNEVKGEKPFFLYFAAQEPHVPRAPHRDFVGKSGLGPRGDVILQFDAAVGELVKMLKEHNLYKDTIIVLSSDNGPILDDGYDDAAVKLAEKNKFSPAGNLSGTKYLCFEGGTRVPFIVNYPKKMCGKGQVSNALVSQVDFLATMAELTESKFNGQHAMDSQGQLATWLGENLNGRDELLTEGRFPNERGIWGGNGGVALITRDWKFFEPTFNVVENIIKNSLLFDLKNDEKEKNNLLIKSPEIAKKMQKRLQELKVKK